MKNDTYWRKEKVMQRQRMKINDLTMSYIDEGKGEVIVLLHGFCGSAAYWERIIPHLTKTHRVIAPSLRGHGKSSAISEPYSIEDMAVDIKYLLEGLQIEKVVLFGHSLGGYVTLAFVEKFPEFTKGFSLMHSTAHHDDDIGKVNRLKNIELICDYGIEPLIKNLTPKLFSPNNYKWMNAEVELVTEVGLNTSVIGAKGALRAMMNRPDRNHVLKNSQVPILLIAGKEDQIIPLEKVLSEKTPSIQLKVLENVGHMGMLESTIELRDIMKGFLNDLENSYK
jgi:3-oxoadipate enol-lactonase